MSACWCWGALVLVYKSTAHVVPGVHKHLYVSDVVSCGLPGCACAWASVMADLHLHHLHLRLLHGLRLRHDGLTHDHVCPGDLERMLRGHEKLYAATNSVVKPPNRLTAGCLRQRP